MTKDEDDYAQCGQCGIPKYRHPYFEDCGHDFLNLECLKQKQREKKK